jgi:hypothetical protein
MSADTTSAGSPAWTTAAADFPFDVLLSGEQITVTNTDGPPANFLYGLNALDAGFEGGQGDWTGAGNCTTAASTAQAHSGTGSMTMTSGAAGNMSAAHCLAGSIAAKGLPCTAGDLIACSAWFLAATTGRLVQAGAGFYTAGAGFISNLSGTAVTDATTGWVKVTAVVTAPATSAFARLFLTVQSAGAANEVHYADDAYIGDQTAGGTSQTMTITRSVNGVVKAQAAGTSLALYHPPVAALI